MKARCPDGRRRQKGESESLDVVCDSAAGIRSDDRHGASDVRAMRNDKVMKYKTLPTKRRRPAKGAARAADRQAWVPGCAWSVGPGGRIGDQNVDADGEWAAAGALCGRPMRASV